MSFMPLYGSTFALSAGAAENTDYFSADPIPNECPGYNNKQSDGEVSAMLELWEITLVPRSTLSRSGST